MSLRNILDEFKGNPYHGGDAQLDNLLEEFRSKPEEKPQQDNQDEDGIFDNISNMGAKAAQGLLAPIATGFKGLDALAGAIAEKTGTEKGGLFGDIGNQLQEWGNSLGNGELDNKYSGQSITDRLLNPDWWTDKYGAQSEIPNALGNAAAFFLPSKWFAGFAVPRAAGAIAARGTGALAEKAGQAGLSRIGKALGSNTAKDWVNSAVQFGMTMAPYGAAINASSIVDSLRACW